LEETKVFTILLGVAVDAFLGLAGVALGLALGAFLGIAALASGNGDKPTKFSIRVENITKPDAFTALNGAKWSLAFSPSTAIAARPPLLAFKSSPKISPRVPLSGATEKGCNVARLDGSFCYWSHML
jgi:hypothetical protein